MRTSTSMGFGVYRGLRPEQPAEPSSLLGLRLWLRLDGSRRRARRLVLARLGAAEDPAATARPQLLEQRACLVRGEHDLVGLCELRLDAVGGAAGAAARAQLLQDVLRLPLRQPHLLSGREQRLELSALGHSCGFSGVPGRPFGKSCLNLRATTSGTSSSTFPPKLAISFTPLEETKLTCGLAIT